MALGGIAALLIALGILGLVYFLFMRMRAGRVAGAPFVKTGEAAAKGMAAADPKGAISVEGNVTCPQPLVGPLSGKSCLYYELKVTATWKDGDSEKSKELSHEKRAAQFGIDDGTGVVWIDAHEGGDFEPEEERSETKTTGLIGGLTGQDLVFNNNFRVSTGLLSIGTKYQVHEQILQAVPRAYVCGKVGTNNVIGAPSWRQLLVTGKSRADYLGHAMQHAKIAGIVAAALTGVGAILGVVSALMPADKPTATAVASASAAPAGTTAAATDTAAVTAATPTATAAPRPTAPAGKPPVVPAKAAKKK
jgi:E3 Ubiquitin ligase